MHHPDFIVCSFMENSIGLSMLESCLVVLQAVSFKKTSRNLARSLWWKNIKITIIIVIVVIVSI